MLLATVQQLVPAKREVNGSTHWPCFPLCQGTRSERMWLATMRPSVPAKWMVNGGKRCPCLRLWWRRALVQPSLATVLSWVHLKLPLKQHRHWHWFKLCLRQEFFQIRSATMPLSVLVRREGNGSKHCPCFRKCLGRTLLQISPAMPQPSVHAKRVVSGREPWLCSMEWHRSWWADLFAVGQCISGSRLDVVEGVYGHWISWNPVSCIIECEYFVVRPDRRMEIGRILFEPGPLAQATLHAGYWLGGWFDLGNLCKWWYHFIYSCLFATNSWHSRPCSSSLILKFCIRIRFAKV